MIRLLTALTLSALATGAAAQESHEELHDALALALASGDAEAVGALYTQDALSFPFRDIAVTGPSGVARSWTGFLDAFTVTEAGIEPLGEIVTDGGVLAWGRFQLYVLPHAGDEPELVAGRYTSFARGEDGVWRFLHSHVSMPAPPRQ